MTYYGGEIEDKKTRKEQRGKENMQKGGNEMSKNGRTGNIRS